MLKIGNNILSGLKIGETVVKSVYAGTAKVYPGVIRIDSGTVYGVWNYNGATRTRTVTLWTQEVYQDNTKGPVINKPAPDQSETASTSYRYGSWSYYSDNSYRQRSRTLVYTFSDAVRDGVTDMVTENGSVSFGAWSYNGATRTRSVTYHYSDASPAGTSQSETASTSYRYGSWSYYSDNSYRQRSRTLVYTFSDVVRDGATDTVTENGSVSFGTWSYNGATRTRSVTYHYSDAPMAGTTQSETAGVSTDWDGSYWNGGCGADYYYVDYQKVRPKYTFSDAVTYGDYYNGDSRSQRIEGSCGWDRAWRVAADWADNGSTCNAAGTAGAHNCDGSKRVLYFQQQRTLYYCFPDMSGSTNTSVEYRAGGVESSKPVPGYCGYVPVRDNPAFFRISNLHNWDAEITLSFTYPVASKVIVRAQFPDGYKNINVGVGGQEAIFNTRFPGGRLDWVDATVSPERDSEFIYSIQRAGVLT